MSLVSVALYSVAFLAFLVVFALAVSQDSETTWLDHVDKIAGFGSFLLAVIALSVSLGVRRSATSMGEAEFLKKATTRLVRESRKHWDDEIRGQGLSAPSPLEVWGKVVDRASARTTVVQRFGEAILHVWGARPGKNGAAAEDVATELLDALWRQVGVRRLVVLGAAGSGKTLVAISFIARLLKERRTGDPVPILVPIGAWNPGQPVWDLLIQHLNEQFPWLADRNRYGADGANRLLANNVVFPVFDGLDEIPAGRRAAALDELERTFAIDEPFVLTCKTGEAAEELSGHALLGSSTVVVELQPLDPVRAAEYLAAADGQEHWREVVDSVTARRDGALAQALSRPLMVSLVRRIYQDRSQANGADPLPDPRELLDVARFPDRERIERHLLDGFIPAVYRGSDGVQSPWKAEDTQRWLTFLAKDVERTRDDGAGGVAWWRLSEAAPRRLVGATVGCLVGIPQGVITGLGEQVGVYAGVGLGLGVIVGLLLISRLHPGKGTGPAVEMAGGLLGGLLGGLAAGFVYEQLGLGWAGSLWGAIPAGLGVGLLLGTAGGAVAGTLGSVIGGLVAGLVVGLGAGPVAGVVNGLAVASAAGVIVTRHARTTPGRTVNWVPQGLLSGLAVGVAATFAMRLATDWVIGLTTGAAMFLVITFAGGLTGSRDDPAATSPRQSLRADRHTFIFLGTTTATAGFIAGAMVSGLGAILRYDRIPDTLANLLANGWAIGLTTAIAAGLLIAWGNAAWGSFTIAGYWLAWRRKLPWRLMAFLEDAHRNRGVLRQVGAVYQFRHSDLQKHLAAHADPGQDGQADRSPRPAGEPDARVQPSG